MPSVLTPGFTCNRPLIPRIRLCTEVLGEDPSSSTSSCSLSLSETQWVRTKDGLSLHDCEQDLVLWTRQLRARRARTQRDVSGWDALQASGETGRYVLFHRQRKDNSESVISFQTNAACVRIGSVCSDQVLSGFVDSGSVSVWSLSRLPPSEHVQSVNYNSTRASSHVKFPHISSGCILVCRNRFSEQSQLVWVQNLSWRRRFCRGCNVGCVHLWVFLSAGDCEAFLIICVVFPSPCSPFLEGYFSECSLRSPYTRNPSGLNFCDNAVSLLLSVAISRPRCVCTTAPSWTCRGRHCRGMMSTPPPLSASLIRPNLI